MVLPGKKAPTLDVDLDALPDLVPRATVQAIVTELLVDYTTATGERDGCYLAHARLVDWIGVPP